jgi:hypothetical protein
MKKNLTPFQHEAKRLYREIRHAGTLVASQSYAKEPGEATPEALEAAALRLEQTAREIRFFSTALEPTGEDLS